MCMLLNRSKIRSAFPRGVRICSLESSVPIRVKDTMRHSLRIVQWIVLRPHGIRAEIYIRTDICIHTQSIGLHTLTNYPFTDEILNESFNDR